MTLEEFGEIREAWTELKSIFDEIDALHDPAGIREMEVDYTYGAQRASAR